MPQVTPAEPSPDCEVCGMGSEESMTVFGHPVLMSERYAQWMCWSCLEVNDEDTADVERGGRWDD